MALTKGSVDLLLDLHDRFLVFYNAWQNQATYECLFCKDDLSTATQKAFYQCTNPVHFIPKQGPHPAILKQAKSISIQLSQQETPLVCCLPCLTVWFDLMLLKGMYTHKHFMIFV
jgi:hypothetical protein